MSKRDQRAVHRLARRFKAAIDERLEVQRIAAEQARLEQERLSRAREDLLDTLQAFGEAVGHFEVVRGDGHLELRYAGKSLRFETVGERGRLKISGDGVVGSNRLFLEEAMDSWVWSREDRFNREHREILFGPGLEKLISAVFDVQALGEHQLAPAPPDDLAAPDDAEAEQAVPFPSKSL